MMSYYIDLNKRSGLPEGQVQQGGPEKRISEEKLTYREMISNRGAILKQVAQGVGMKGLGFVSNYIFKDEFKLEEPRKETWPDVVEKKVIVSKKANPERDYKKMDIEQLKQAIVEDKDKDFGTEKSIHFHLKDPETVLKILNDEYHTEYGDLIEALKSADVLKIEGKTVGDNEIAEILQFCPNLKELSLYDSNLTDIGFNSILKKCPEVETLFFFDCSKIEGRNFSVKSDKLKFLFFPDCGAFKNYREEYFKTYFPKQPITAEMNSFVKLCGFYKLQLFKNLQGVL